jgi:nicotinamidase-related amidase
MRNSDADAQRALGEALASIDEYYKQRGIFQDRFGFGSTPAIVVVDFALGWTDESYGGGSARLNEPVEKTRLLLAAGRAANVPIIYTTAAYRPHTGDQPFKTAADVSPQYRAWDQRACQIDERVSPDPKDLIIEKDNASAFFGTHLTSYLVQQRVDTLLITGCSTSACIRATATDAKSYRFLPVIVRDCVGDRSAACHVFTLHDIQSRFADVVSLEEALNYLAERPRARQITR